MDTLQNNGGKRVPILDFTPAQLHKGKKGRWYVDFYVLNPTNNKMKRFQRRVKPIPKLHLRIKYANKMVLEINDKLFRGWNPIIQMESTHSFALLPDVLRLYIRQLKKEVKDHSIRPDTLRAYSSYVENILKWSLKNHGEIIFCLKFDKQFVGEFLDHIYYDRNNSPRTYNNYLGFIKTIGNYLLRRDYIKANPALAFKKKNVGEKKREIIPLDSRTLIMEYFERRNQGMAVACYLMYYQLIRRTEMSKLKVSDFDLKNKTISIRPQVSKNGVQQYLTILDQFMPYLITHLQNSSNDLFLFSGNNLRPGKNKIEPKELSDEWAKMRKQLDLKQTYQFYSLKDTGINDMLLAGVPPIVVRDHARHSELSMTEKYTSRNNNTEINKYFGTSR